MAAEIQKEEYTTYIINHCSVYLTAYTPITAALNTKFKATQDNKTTKELNWQPERALEICGMAKFGHEVL